MGILLQHHDDGLLMSGWHDRRGRHRRVLSQMCLYWPLRLSGMTDEISTVACWIGCVKMHRSGNLNSGKMNRLAMSELLNSEMKFEYQYELY